MISVVRMSLGSWRGQSSGIGRQLNGRPANPGKRSRTNRTCHSPSPVGEGRGEGGRSHCRLTHLAGAGQAKLWRGNGKNGVVGRGRNWQINP